MNDTTTPPTTERQKAKRGKAKPKDPTRVPVKRERSEMYVLVGHLEAAQKARAALVKRIEAASGLKTKLALVDADISACGERLRMLMDGTAAEAAVPVGE